MNSSLLAGSRSWQSASLPGQRRDVERALAPGQLAGLARRLAGDRGLDDLGDDLLGLGRMLLEPAAELFADQPPRPPGRTSEETSLSLVCDENFGSGTLTESTQVSPSRASSPVIVAFSFLATAEST